MYDGVYTDVHTDVHMKGDGKVVDYFSYLEKNTLTQEQIWAQAEYNAKNPKFEMEHDQSSFLSKLFKKLIRL